MQRQARPASKRRTVYELYKPPENRSIRRLPSLLAASLALLWSAARREFLLVTVFQVLNGASAGLVLVLVKRLLDALMGGRGFGSVAV